MTHSSSFFFRWPLLALYGLVFCLLPTFAHASVTRGASGNYATVSGSGISTSIAVGAPTDGILLVGVVAGTSVTNITVAFNSTPLTEIGYINDSSILDLHVFALLAPSGTHNLDISAIGGGNVSIVWAVYSGVDQTTPLGSISSAHNNNSANEPSLDSVATTTVSNAVMFSYTGVNDIASSFSGGGSTLFEKSESGSCGALAGYFPLYLYDTSPLSVGTTTQTATYCENAQGVTVFGSLNPASGGGGGGSSIYSNAYGTIDSAGNVTYTGNGASIMFNLVSPDLVQRSPGGPYPFGTYLENFLTYQINDSGAFQAGFFNATDTVSQVMSQAFNGAGASLLPLTGNLCLGPPTGSFTSCDPWITVTVGPSTFTASGDTSTTTHIVDFSPTEGEATASPVTFRLHVYINPDDLGSLIGVKLWFHNIDQNVLLASAFSPNDFYLLNQLNATTSGDFFYNSGPITIPDGNYRINAVLERSYLAGWLRNPLSPINQNLSHQFIVGSSTFIGNLTQNGFRELQSFYASSSATTTEALANSCNPLNGAFDIRNCGAFLLLPGGQYLDDTLTQLRDDTLSRAPWGYFTRVYEIWRSNATTSLPTFTVHVVTGPGDSSNNSTTSLAFDPGDMIAGAGTLLESIHDPINGKTPRDVFGPIVQLGVALVVLLTIITDLTGAHKHITYTETGQPKKLS